MIRRFFIAFAVGFVCMFGTTVSYACTSDEIDVLGDGTNCQTAKFTITTTEIADGETFQFYMSAKGTFYVDCGAGGTLSSSASDVSGMTITRSNTTGATYTCTYTGDTEAKTIRFGGIAGTATNKPYSTANTAAASVIRFNVTPTLVASVSGSLGAIFPTRNATYTPKFRETFSGCTNLTEIPSTLFSGVTGSATYQFYRTFYGCISLESIPDGLFSGISGTKAYLFYQTFYNCSALTGYIPAGMFDKITTYSTNMMSSMFYGTGLDTTCSGTTVQYITGFESYWNSKVSCTEPFVTPVVLDGQSATTGAAPTTVYLKYRTGWYADVDATTPISALTTNPTKTDYDFDGYWTATNGAGTQIIDADGGFITTDAAMKISKITDASKTIYANWTTDYTVTYDCGDGTGTPPENGTATLTKSFTPALNTCENDEYMFTGWLVSGTSDVKTGDFTWNYTENKTFTAQFTIPIKFTITTTQLSAGDNFGIHLSAKGTFYIDWGDGSATEKITRTQVGNSTSTIGRYYHVYVNGSGEDGWNIHLGGVATGYSTVTSDAGGMQSVIKFPSYQTKIAKLKGSLGAVFPTLDGASSYSTNPRFISTFADSTNLTEIPSTLFDGVTRPYIGTFSNTFLRCTRLTSIPVGLFSTVQGAPAQSMFISTFSDCSGLTGSIPENLFSGISGAPAERMFSSTFYGCRGVTGSIPENLFSGISGAPAKLMFGSTFSGCSGLTGSIPENLFSGISGAPAEGMFSNTFGNCSGLTGSIPSELFAGISGAPAGNMFQNTFFHCSGLTGSIPSGLFGNLSGAGANAIFADTFDGCSNLSGYVPKDIFENITSTGSGGVSRTFTNTNLYTECPCGTKPAETGWGATVVDGRAVCEVGTKDNEHWNNGVCITDCGKLKTSTGLEYPILSVATSQHSINVGVGNDVCHVPLANGAANNAINVSFDGATYHATVPDEIVPTGFTGQPAPVEPD